MPGRLNSMRMPLLWFLVLAPSLAFVPAQEAETELPDLLPDELLICRDRKVARGVEVGLYLRDDEGGMHRVWDGEPYDALWLLDKSVMVVDRYAGKVTHLSKDFEPLKVISGFDEPVDVERNSEGHWIVVENRKGQVVAVDPLTEKRLWAREGFSNPFDAAVLADGGILVADSGNDRIVRLDAQGKQVGLWSKIDFPNTVEACEDGGFVCTDWTGGNVRRYGSNGKLRWRTGVGGTLQSADERPDGRFVVTEGYSGKVYYLDPKGVLERTESFPLGCVDGELVLRL